MRSFSQCSSVFSVVKITVAMTDRLYYRDSFLYDFEGEVCEVADSPRPALILDRTAFYPTSGGQVFDTGWITPVGAGDDSPRFRVTEVVDSEDGRVVHYLEAPLKDLKPGTRVRGQVDAQRRRDHMQQHSGTACAFCCIRPFLQFTDSFISHGRRLLLH